MTSKEFTGTDNKASPPQCRRLLSPERERKNYPHPSHCVQAKKVNVCLCRRRLSFLLVGRSQRESISG